MTSNEHDLDLLSRIKKGDKNAEAELIKKYRERIWVYFNHKRLLKTDVDDLCQEVLLETLQKARNGALVLIKSDFRNYLYGICWNKFCEHLRKKYKDRDNLVHLDAPSHFGNPSFDLPDEKIPSIFEEKELQAELNAVMRLFKSLPPRDQNVLWDYWVNKMPAKVVGERYGMSALSVRQIASRAKSGLREKALQAFKKLVTILTILLLLV